MSRIEQRFAALKKDLVMPVLLEVAEVLKGKGHDATVQEQEESSSTAGGVTSAAIGLRVVPRPFAQKATDAKRSFVEVTFSANRSERKIVVSSTTTIMNSSGSVGKRGEYEIDAVTGDVVVDHVLLALEKAFAAS